MKHAGTAGLGAGAVKAIVAHNPAHVYFTGRNSKRANELIASIRKELPSAALTFLACDQTKLSSVSDCAKSFLSQAIRLDVLMCNAGVMALEPGTTEDGYEQSFQINHLSHALLTKLLLPLLRKTAAEPNSDVRIVNLSSIAYEQAPSCGIEFSTLRTTQSSLGMPLLPGHKWSRYGQSKLANMLYADALAKQYPEITSVSIHPGVIRTDLFNSIDFLTALPVLVINIGNWTPVEEGCYNQVWAATCDKSALKSGEYYVPLCTVGKRTTRQAKDAKLVDELWTWTQKALESFD
jgi:NAD(P)-dependent dehydrogenase (short-subunit alcohol dehydrogenase family)